MKNICLSIIAAAFVLSTASLSVSQEMTAGGQPNKPASDITSQSDQYVIGSEDILHIHVWREETLTKTVPVRMDGKISLPLVDDFQAAGLTPLQLKEALKEKLSEFIDNPNVTVTVMEANSFKVFVSGEVRQPGVHRIRSLIKLTQLIITAGGFTDWADQKNILIITKDKGAEKRILANYRKIINGEQPDIVINRGDTVIVR